MKKSFSITMVVLLVLAVISLFLVYRQYTGARDKLMNCETSVSDLNEKVSQLTKANTALQEKAEAASLVEQVKSRYQAALSKLSQEIQSYDGKLTSLHEKLSAKTAQARELEGKLAKAQGEIEILRHDISSLAEEKRAAEDRLSSLHEKLNAKIARVRDLEKNLSKVQGEIEILKQELSSLTKEKRTSEDRLAKAEEKKAEAASLMEQLKAEHEAVVSKLSQEILSRDDSLSELIEQKGRVEGQLAQAALDCEAAVSRLKREIGDKDFRIAENEKDIGQIRSGAEALKKDVEARERRIEFLEQRISDLFGEKELLKTRIGRLETTHRSMLSELQSQIAKKEVTIHELKDKLTITFVDRILFKFGMATISSEGKEILTRVGNILKNVKDRKIRVIGHTDTVPIMDGYRYKFPSNWELSSARAAAVVRLFQNEIGLAPETLEAVGRSFYDPVATNETEEGRAQNRRVNIIITHKGE